LPAQQKTKNQGSCGPSKELQKKAIGVPFPKLSGEKGNRRDSGGHQGEGVKRVRNRHKGLLPMKITQKTRGKGEEGEKMGM